MTMPSDWDDNERLLRPGQVADLFHVDPKTVGRWAKEGILGYVETLKGHRRFRESDVRALLEERRRPMKTVTLPHPERITERPKIRT